MLMALQQKKLVIFLLQPWLAIIRVEVVYIYIYISQKLQRLESKQTLTSLPRVAYRRGCLSVWRLLQQLPLVKSHNHRLNSSPKLNSYFYLSILRAREDGDKHATRYGETVDTLCDADAGCVAGFPRFVPKYIKEIRG